MASSKRDNTFTVAFPLFDVWKSVASELDAEWNNVDFVIIYIVFENYHFKCVILIANIFLRIAVGFLQLVIYQNIDINWSNAICSYCVVLDGAAYYALHRHVASILIQRCHLTLCFLTYLHFFWRGDFNNGI